MQITPLERFTAPLGGEEIELQEVVHDGGGMQRCCASASASASASRSSTSIPRRRGPGRAAMERWAATQPGADAGREP